MKTFREFIQEHVLSIGLNPKHDKYRDQHRQEIHDILTKSYAPIGGYGNLGSGTKEESDAIHKDISTSFIKAYRRGGKITSVNLYRDQYGRKSIAAGTDGSEQGKIDFKKNKIEDNKQKRAWGEASGKVAAGAEKVGMPKVPSSEAEKLVKKPIISKDADGHSYTRMIGDKEVKKAIYGHPKYEKES